VRYSLTDLGEGSGVEVSLTLCFLLQTGGRQGQERCRVHKMFDWVSVYTPRAVTVQSLVTVELKMQACGNDRLGHGVIEQQAAQTSLVAILSRLTVSSTSACQCVLTCLRRLLQHLHSPGHEMTILAFDVGSKPVTVTHVGVASGSVSSSCMLGSSNLRRQSVINRIVA
jgi:hypothetical protein